MYVYIICVLTEASPSVRDWSSDGVEEGGSGELNEVTRCLFSSPSSILNECHIEKLNDV